ncbi:MAG TPA: TetR/AcrR family transcriptional regulator C-terminal domain-containing protein [Candidatus Saccharimonadales bacterium]|jgi:TetR/AcrR family tetracycline transcriptional repressor|nr:TetR/AcrR family transcriptional regulator C-terminal domain-containing protein [Candidatus Saccharimonadales bacterium]
MIGHGRRELNLARLEKKRRFINKRLERQRLRINDQFDRQEALISHHLNHKQEEIIAAALVLLDADGLTNLSLRKLADSLDMQAPGLYWHFKNKEILIDYLAEDILKKEFKGLQPRSDDESWQDWLSKTMNRLRSVMLAHKDGARIVAGAHLYPAVTLGNLYELSIRSLHEAGLSLEDSLHIVTTTTTYTFGYVIEEQSSPSIGSFGDQLNALGQEYPTIAKAIKASKQHNPTNNRVPDFNVGLQLIINGAK